MIEAASSKAATDSATSRAEAGATCIGGQASGGGISIGKVSGERHKIIGIQNSEYHVIKTRFNNI
jgi:hypothetical protein